MYVVQPSFSQKCVAWTCLRRCHVGSKEGSGKDLRDAVAEPRVCEFVDDHVD